MYINTIIYIWILLCLPKKKIYMDFALVFAFIMWIRLGGVNRVGGGCGNKMRGPLLTFVLLLVNNKPTWVVVNTKRLNSKVE